MSAEEVARWFMERGIRFEIGMGAGGKVFWTFLDGFYKSDGMAYLSDEADGCVLSARYDERIIVANPLDVVRSSKGWHEFSEDRFDGWRVPPDSWKALYELLP